MIRLYVQGKPIPKGNHKAFQRGSKIFITDAQGGTLSDWQDAIRVQARKYCKSPISETVFFLRVTFMFKHPKNHYTAKGDKSKHWRYYHVKRPDVDKLLRAVLDALTGTVYDDDSQVQLLNSTKKYADVEGAIIEIWTEEELLNVRD